jgi:heme-degrading monooxygenase HmoA
MFDEGKDMSLFVATNRFRVIPAEAERFEQAWLTRESHLHEVPGFVSFHLMRGPKAEDHVLYCSLSFWASRAAFEGWTRSEQFRKAHAGAGAVSKPATLGPPQFEGFEVLQSLGEPEEGAAGRVSTAPGGRPAHA